MAITFGTAGVPSQKTINIDSLFAMSLAAYKKELFDNIASSNAALNMLMKSNAYESQAGGTHIEVPLMYALGTMDWYDGYDELSTLPTDGVTNAIYEWRQCAIPISYSMKEVKQNKQRILRLVETRIKQAELGIIEGFSTAFMQGGGAGALTTAASSGVNGASGINPLPLLVAFDPTTSTSIGNINQSTSTWWRNKTKTSSATTYDGFILEVNNLFNSCSLGTGGSPNLGIADQTTFELFNHGLYQKYRQINRDSNFNFDNVVHRGCRFVLDDKVPDVANNTVSLTEGSLFLLNLKFFHMIYEEDSDFELLKDDSGKTFQKPTNGDSRVAHIAWMGNVGVSNRRKHGVMGDIATSLT